MPCAAPLRFGNTNILDISVPEVSTYALHEMLEVQIQTFCIRHGNSFGILALSLTVCECDPTAAIRVYDVRIYVIP